MMRIILAVVLTAIGAPSVCGQVTYSLTSVGSGELNDVLGGNSALRASEFYDFMKTKWKVPTVEPIYKDGVIDNVRDLIPSKIIVVPEKLTIHTSQVKGSYSDYRRLYKSLASPLPAIVNPAEDSVFIYAYNAAGKLIYPLVRNSTGDDKLYTSIYNIKVFQEHSNLTSFSRPIVTSTDIDAPGGYTKDIPNMNPPHALMFRGRMVGQYSLMLAIQFNDQFISINTPEEVKMLAQKVVTTSVEVNVVDGPETIDSLQFTSSKSLGLQDPTKNLVITLKEGETLEVSLSGRKTRPVWNEAKRQYQADGTLTVMLKQAYWNYYNLIQKPDWPYDADLISIQKLSADGTYVRVVANKLATAATEGKGLISIEAHGRRFDVKVRVIK